MASYPFVLWCSIQILSKVLRLPGRNWGGIIRSAFGAALRKSAPWLRKSAPWPPNMFDSIMCLLYCACYAKSIFAEPLPMPLACHLFVKRPQAPQVFFCIFDKVQNPLHHTKRRFKVQKWSKRVVVLPCLLGNAFRAATACTFSTSKPPKAVRSYGSFTILTWQCASRHNGMHFFNIWICKSGSSISCFLTWKCASCHNGVHFFNIRTSKTGSNIIMVPLPFWLGNVLRATMVCTFSTSELPKVVRASRVFVTWTCASRRNGGHSLNSSTSKSVPRRRRRRRRRRRCFAHFESTPCTFLNILTSKRAV